MVKPDTDDLRTRARAFVLAGETALHKLAAIPKATPALSGSVSPAPGLRA